LADLTLAETELNSARHNDLPFNQWQFNDFTKAEAYKKVEDLNIFIQEITDAIEELQRTRNLFIYLFLYANLA
jgi:hypothetical protein